MKKVISNDLGRPADEIFSHFIPEPVGGSFYRQVLRLYGDGWPGSSSKGAKAGVPEMVEEDMYILGAQRYPPPNTGQEHSNTTLLESYRKYRTQLKSRWTIFRKAIMPNILPGFLGTIKQFTCRRFSGSLPLRG